MTDDGVRNAALAYCNQVLARTAYFVDATWTEEDWTARLVLVQEKERKGSAEPKRWYVLYEVHLDAEFKPLYHVRKGYWNKALPADAGPAEAGTQASAEEVPGEENRDDASQEGLRIGFAAPRAGEETPESVLAEASAVERQPEPGAGRETGPSHTVGPATRDSVGVAREEAEPAVTESVFVAGRKPPEFPVEEAEGEQIQEQAAEATEVEVPEERTPEAEPGGAEDITLTEGPPAVAAPGTAGGPSRPLAQERQGPPKVTFRFASDNAVRRPGEGE